MLLVMSSDGQMTARELARECASGKWAPLLVYRRAGDDTTRVPWFHSKSAARRFWERNVPKHWAPGAMEPSQGEVDWMRQRGWVLEEFEFPRKLLGLPGVELYTEILELSEVPDVLGSFGRGR